MSSKKRLLSLGAVLILVGFVLWGREVVSWRPQNLGVWPKAILWTPALGGPWFFPQADRLINLDTPQNVVLPAGFTLKSDDFLVFAPDSQSYVVFKDGVVGHTPLEWRDAQSGHLRRRFDIQFDALQGDDVSFAADGAHLIISHKAVIETLPLNGSAPTFFTPALSKGFVDYLSIDGRWLVDGLSVNIGTHSRSTECLKIYDIAKRRLVQTLRMKPLYLEAPQFSPDGKLFSYRYYADEGTISFLVVIEVSTGQILWTRNADALLFSPDSNTVAVVSGADNIFELREARTQRLVRELALPANALSGHLAFSPEGDALYTLSKNGALWKMRVH